MALVVVHGLAFVAGHGVSPAEQRQQRRFQLDLEIETDVEAAAAADDLARTVDYHEACALALAAATARTAKLLERVAVDVREALLARWPAARVTVEVRKLEPPCPGTPAYAAVRVSGGR